MSADDDSDTERGANRRKRSASDTSNRNKKAAAVKKLKLSSQSATLSQQPSTVNKFEGTSGKIIRVRLTNFMCHQNFLFTFGDKVNFISGRNGSGKSAILTAMVLGLGGRTTDTNRGSSVAKLLRNGAHRGTTEITISNQGFLNYQQEIFGNEITVIRTITDKASSYKIISERGQVISRKKNDLMLLTMALNIKVNNPVSILNQDTARTFLSKATPKELYGLFKMGSLIDDIEQRLSSLRSGKMPVIEAKLDRQNEVLQESLRDLLEYAKLKKKYDELQAHQESNNQLQRVLSWAYVAELENKLSDTEEKKIAISSKVENLKQNIESRNDVELNLNEKLSSLETRFREVNSGYEASDMANASLEPKVTYQEGLMHKKQSQMNKLHKHMQIEMSRCQEVEAEIANKQSEDVVAKLAKRNEIVQRIAVLKERVAERKAIISTSEVHRQQLSDTNEEITRKVDETQSYVNNLMRKIAHKQQYLKNMKSERNELQVFSEWMPQFVENLVTAHQRGRFSQLPRGPFGRYIKLKDESWGPAIESHLGRSLQNFAVCNSKDADTFKRMLEQMKIPKNDWPNIVLTKFQNETYDCSSSEASHPKYSNMFRMMEISDPVVANVLLDMSMVDTILLVTSTEETYPLVSDQHKVPRNCKSVLNKDGTKFFPSPDYRCYCKKVSEKSRYLQVSPEQAIRMTENYIKTVQDDVVTHKAALKAQMEEQVVVAGKLGDLIKECEMLRTQLKACEGKLSNDERLIMDMDLPESVDVALLVEDVEFRKASLKKIKSQLQIMEQEKKEAKETYASLKETLNENEKRKNELKAVISELQKEISDVKNQLRKYNINHDHFKESLKMEMTVLERCNDKINTFKKELETAIKTASDLSPERIAYERSSADLKLSIAELSHTLKALEKIVQKNPIKPSGYQSKCDRFAMAKQALEKMEVVMKVYQDNASELVKELIVTRDSACSSMKNNFKKILAKRNFIGDINVDHEKKTLVINVKPDPNVEADTAITTLSGGERSFSMVAFILSLWEHMSTPFYFLDEFDVFMDEMNRKLVMDLLMSHARDNPSKQFVFLTPHATSEHSSESVNFFRMKDPRE